MKYTTYNGDLPNLDWTPFLLNLFRDQNWNLCKPKYKSSLPAKKDLQGVETNAIVATSN
jgi:hypothetical protein